MNRLREKTTATILIAIFMISAFAVAMPALAVNVVHVYPGSGNLQSAITAASSGAVLIVHAGTYTEDLIIDKSLELMAAIGEAVTIKGIATAVWPNMPTNIEVVANDVEIHGFTIESPTVSATPVDTASGGLVLDGTNIEIYDNLFVSVGAGPTSTFGQCFVIQTLHQEWGGDVSGLSIHDNDFTGTPAGGYVGIYINPGDSSGTVTVTDNTFVGPIIQGIMTEHDDTIIHGNTLDTSLTSDYRVGIGAYDLGAGSVTPSDGSLSDVEIYDNEVYGFQQGVRLGVTGKTLSLIKVYNNLVEGNDYGVRVSASAGSVLLNYNNIVDNDMDVENLDSAELNAENNWWGTLVEDEIKMKISGDVDYTPWLNAAFPEGQSVSEGTATMTASVSYPVVSISVTDAVVEFDPVTAGGDPQTDTVTITHTGSSEIDEEITWELIADTNGFYGTYLSYDPSSAFTLSPAATQVVTLTLDDIPLTIEPGVYTGTLVFWAEAVEP